MAPPWSPSPRASPRVGGLRVPSGVSEPPRDFHEARGAGGKPRQGALRMMTGRSEGEKKTELLLREVGRSRPRRLTSSMRLRENPQRLGPSTGEVTATHLPLAWSPEPCIASWEQHFPRYSGKLECVLVRVPRTAKRSLMQGTQRT
nr:basic leucine zipper transcriptional factor ATF-like 3 isoform X1 [Gorilla gorilla gorilla]